MLQNCVNIGSLRRRRAAGNQKQDRSELPYRHAKPQDISNFNTWYAMLSNYRPTSGSTNHCLWASLCQPNIWSKPTLNTRSIHKIRVYACSSSDSCFKAWARLLEHEIRSQSSLEISIDKFGLFGWSSPGPGCPYDRALWPISHTHCNKHRVGHS